MEILSGKQRTSVYQAEVVDMHNTKSFNTVTASFYIIVKTGQTSDSLYSSFQGYYIDSFPG